jgi:hypothetical protein
VSALTSATGGLGDKDFEEVIKYAEFRKARLPWTAQRRPRPSSSLMSRRAYYEGLQELARSKRAEHGVETAAFGLRKVRQIYKKESIRIDHRPLAFVPKNQSPIYVR